MVDKLLKGGLEDNILTILCFDSKHASQLALRVPVDLFSTRPYRVIAKAAYAHLERYGEPPRLHLYDLLEADLRRGDEGKLLGSTLNAMKALAPEIQTEYVLSELQTFIDSRRMILQLEAASDKVHAGDLQGAKEALYAGEGARDTVEGVWLSDASGMLSFLEDREEDYFPSGAVALDEMGVRPARGELFLIIAAAKKGKSWWMTEIGKQGVMHRKQVLHITLENSQRLAAKRYVQALFAMASNPLRNLRVPSFSRDNEGRCTAISMTDLTADGRNLPEVLSPDMKGKLARKLKGFQKRSRLMIKQFPTASLTIAGLTAFLDQLERVENFKPDLLILDYVNLLAMDRKNMRTELGRTLMELRGVGVARNMAVVTATQGSKIAASADTVGATMIAEDWSMIGTADTVVTYSQTASEKRLNLARLFVAAARTVRDGFIVLVSQSYESGQFALDSIYMNEYAEEAHEKLAGKDKGKTNANDD
jgi:hypothetical protein